ncbi:MAG TPA: NIPSNAP family protein [Chthoniobacterales bacterium]
MKDAAPNSVIEILTIDLKPGRRDEFHQLYVSEALPLLKRWNFQVVAHGPSLHDQNSYYVIRQFKSLEERQRSEDAYYSSDDWQKGPRSRILGLADHFAYAVISAKTLTAICSPSVLLP